jgi:GT2 family glycosyltransferase
MKTLICILAHNNLTLTKACVASALKQDVPCDVLVFDNASSDNTPQWLGATGTIVIAVKDRMSVAGCWNFVLELAFTPGKYDAVLVLNNDTEVREDCVRWLSADPAPFVTAISVRTREEMNYPNPPTTRRPHPDFSCFMIKCECWKRVGRFDERFEVAFFEDNDYHVRAHRAGVELIGIDLPFLHHGSQTVKRADPAEMRMIQRAAERNRKLFRSIYGCEPGSKDYENLFV